MNHCHNTSASASTNTKFIPNTERSAMTIKTLTILASAIVAVLVVFAPCPAVAAIDELLVYPGSNCIRISGGTPTYTSSGRLQNNTGATMGVQCPMYDNGFDFSGNIWVVTPSATVAVACSSVVRNPLGSPSASQLKSGSGNPGVLTFDGPDALGTFTYRFYNCTLPPGTQIISYRGRAL
jgi:hypothetical protein